LSYRPTGFSDRSTRREAHRRVDRMPPKFRMSRVKPVLSLGVQQVSQS